jgi:hypothetical protein
MASPSEKNDAAGLFRSNIAEAADQGFDPAQSQPRRATAGTVAAGALTPSATGIH